MRIYLFYLVYKIFKKCFFRKNITNKDYFSEFPLAKNAPTY